MKQATIFLIQGYQNLVSPFLHQILGVKNMCRYEVSCSEYAKHSIAEYGILRGGVLAMKRLLSCQPFSKMSSFSS